METRDRLYSLIAKVVGLEIGSIRDNSNFFGIGGDSISALKLTKLCKDENLFLTVDDIFDYPEMADLVRISGKRPATNGTRNQPKEPKTPLQTINPNTLCRQPTQEESSKCNLAVLPTTGFQRWSLSGMHYRYFRISLPASIDRNRLFHSCELLVQRHDSLRTAFAKQDGDNGKTVVQIVHPSVRIQFQENNQVESLDRHCDEDTRDAVEPPVDGKPPFQVQIVTLKDSRAFLVLRFAHAQWDGFSLASITNDLSAAYNNLPLSPTTQYFQHASAAWATHTDDAFKIWMRVLEGSQMTKMDAGALLLLPKESARSEIGIKMQEPYTVKITKTIPKEPLSSLPTNISMGTVIKTAWAMTLMHSFRRKRTSEENQVHDVVFGQVTNGRALGIPNESHIIGPCTNIIPVRVRLTGTSITKLDLLRKVQRLYLDTRAYENVEFEHIVKRCTTWASDTKYGSIVRFQNYDFNPTTWLEGTACKGSLYYVPNRPSETANIAIFPFETELSVVMTVSNHTLNEQEAQCIVDEFCKQVQEFSNDHDLDEPVNLQYSYQAPE
ncbi:uncharacterized protein N7487_001133 [Penicillium crustosum]|nr:uncharacterized protein N7487_001133 [Penicillium crustosum]KAJ5417583.1 hypothetical protein N7487_001133 [Penicillium crustosum]